MSEPPPLPGSTPPPLPGSKPRAKKAARKERPPTQKQLDYIAALGGDPEVAKSLAHASDMIDALKEESESRATNRQMARMIFIGLQNDPRSFSRRDASDVLDEYISDYNTKTWNQYKAWRESQGMRDVPEVRFDYEAARAEIEQWRDENEKSAGGCLKAVFAALKLLGFIILALFTVGFVIALFAE